MRRLGINFQATRHVLWRMISHTKLFKICAAWNINTPHWWNLTRLRSHVTLTHEFLNCAKMPQKTQNSWISPINYKNIPEDTKILAKLLRCQLKCNYHIPLEAVLLGLVPKIRCFTNHTIMYRIMHDVLVLFLLITLASCYRQISLEELTTYVNNDFYLSLSNPKNMTSIILENVHTTRLQPKLSLVYTHVLQWFNFYARSFNLSWVSKQS